MDVGKRIKAARKELGLSQSDLAGMTNVSQPTVANWENGSHAPRHATLSKIADALHATPSSLLEAGAMPTPATPLQNHHVPILQCPQTQGDIDSGSVIGYMNVSCNAARPFAFAADRDYAQFNVARGDTLVFDRAQTAFDDSAIYMAFDSGGISLMKARDLPIEKDAPPRTRLVMSISKF